MSKYNKLPQKMTEKKPQAKEELPISSLCCLPIFMHNNKEYKNQVNNLMSLEELLPKTFKLQIYQMLYMDKLLNQLKDYSPEVGEEITDPFSIIEKISPNNKDSNTTAMMKTLMKYQKTKDPMSLFEMLSQKDPMLSMLMPMMMMNKSNSSENSNSSNMMETLLPMMMGKDNMLASLLSNMK